MEATDAPDLPHHRRRRECRLCDARELTSVIELTPTPPANALVCADELDVGHWDPDREIAECLDVVEQTRRRVEDAPRQSHLLDEAKKNLRDRGEPERGSALDDELVHSYLTA